jgi:hypothetical protein
MEEMSEHEASRQLEVLDSVLVARLLEARLLDSGELPGEVVAELVRVGLLVERDGKVAPTEAAIHYATLLELV